MNIGIKYLDVCVSSIPLELVPFMVTDALLKHPGISVEVTVVDPTVSEEDQDACREVINSIKEQFKLNGYAYIQVGNDYRMENGKKRLNPMHYHIPHVDNSALQIYRDGLKLIIKKEKISEVIDKLTLNDFNVNEALGDIMGLGHFPAYHYRRDKVVQEYESKKNAGV